MSKVMNHEKSQPDWFLEKKRLAGVPLTPADQSRLRELGDEDARILRDYPPELMAARIDDELRRRAIAGSVRRAARTRTARWPRAAAAALVLVVPAYFALREPPAPRVGTANDLSVSTDRAKGGRAHLVLYRKVNAPDGAGAFERLADGAPARARDIVQIRYVAAGAKYGAIFSVDGTGGVTPHLPATGRQGVALDAEGILPSSFELDEAPGFERFVFVTSDRPFEIPATWTGKHEALTEFAITLRKRETP